MFLLAVLIISISSNVVQPKNPACEQLIECYAKSRAKTDECLSRTEKRVCQNESLESELRELTNDRISLYENCLREKLPTATTIENEKKKVKCNAILKKNLDKRKKLVTNEKERGKNNGKSRRSIHKGKKISAQQKLCFREARKLRSYCGQLSKCCTISKLCKANTLIDEQIVAKRMEIKEADEQCRLEYYGSIKAKNYKNHKREGYHRGGGGQRRISKSTDSNV
ncbi:Uncharacterized protein BM_BM9969 [Brugia malayi]|uniref:Bm9969 n=2 Tax=Brugia TaxID=6278 RepID=A0A0J9XV24_BRUMA|nr:Uncharacterized protein BM_BM9969 [Brugia malayi]CDP96292.1 Bm9969 [Brugia malayi]VDO20270.1 unnamed protein product [Brugia timori]VIO98443.1 Uncharacterized protein BM_BM9969 [Brugia malayi]